MLKSKNENSIESVKIPRILIGAAGSGSGKTTIVTGLLRAMLDRKIKLCSFKCGPDYIDPMFHQEALGISSGNLDLFFNDSNTVNYLIAKNAKDMDIAVIEGVMGYYDGVAGKTYDAGAYDLARKTGTPSILVVDCKGKSVSVLAEIKGFLELEPDSNIKGVILNRISPMIYEEIREIIEERIPVKVLGYMPYLKDCTFESRHLGLVTVKEISNIEEIINKVAETLKETIDFDALLEIAQSAPEIVYESPKISRGEKVRIGVALDSAFCFYYRDNLKLLETMGAELCYFSPINDRALPENIQGIYIGGGYPELYLKELELNIGMKNSIREAIASGIPCIAECGGFMYLHEKLGDKEGKFFQMVGALSGESFYAGKLVRFGYIDMEAQKESLILEKGDNVRAHEFHYWDSSHNGETFVAKKPYRKANWTCVVGDDNLYAGYPHIHFYANLKVPERFLEKCRKIKIKN